MRRCDRIRRHRLLCARHSVLLGEGSGQEGTEECLATHDGDGGTIARCWYVICAPYSCVDLDEIIGHLNEECAAPAFVVARAVTFDSPLASPLSCSSRVARIRHAHNLLYLELYCKLCHHECVHPAFLPLAQNPTTMAKPYGECTLSNCKYLQRRLHVKFNVRWRHVVMFFSVLTCHHSMYGMVFPIGFVPRGRGGCPLSTCVSLTSRFYVFLQTLTWEF